MEKPKIAIVMPAYNAASTLIRTYEKIPKTQVDLIILVDDASGDLTAEIANRIGLKVFRHIKNYGYGGNQKTCYTEALRAGADIVVMLHPDYQYDPRLIPQIVAPILNGESDIVMGSRFLTDDAMQRGMPWWKFFGNRFLTSIENLVLKRSISEYHSGYRAYSRHFLQSIPYQEFSNGFVFDQEILIAAIDKNYLISEIPAPARYFEDSSSINFSNSVRYGLATLEVLFRHLLSKKRLPKRTRTPEPVEYVRHPEG